MPAGEEMRRPATQIPGNRLRQVTWGEVKKRAGTETENYVKTVMRI